MNPTPHIQGWCPGAWQPMASGDGLVVRVRPPLGRLTVAQARRLARLALVHGNGALELSSRANVQLRGIAPERHGAVLRALAAAGLLDADAGRERRRNLVVDPLCQPQEQVHALGRALQQALDDADDLAGLPAKFGWSVEGSQGRLAGVSADIRLQRASTGWLVQPDGRGQALAVADAGQAVAVGLVLARWFAGQAARRRAQGLRPGRMAAVAEALEPPPGMAWVAAQPAVHGEGPAPGAVPGLGWLVGAPLGRLRAEALALLLRALPGATCLRATPWRMLLLEDPAAGAQRPAWWAAAGLDGASDWITEARDPRLRVSACTGAPGCTQALGPTQALALELAAQVPEGAHLHVTGCAKGCARQAPASVVLRAEEQQGQGPVYAVVRHGRAGDRAQEQQTLAAVRDNPGLLFSKE
ncbi:ferredoxin-nitrite reductase [Delftia tsuruhatensis]|uniref:precorrin-3B synthase n=1 Tax=Delftia tsuruhatensis TaxID=180282 RepID=UPI001E6ED7DA|nr:precorrin-3B synthase [Delftia tsuruhatensis]CAB5691242.1 ferredoxin-nitrite reductase [Delftia tsuruhatensis]CAC9676914.1 ferredoxin-nitrite reductase [Delftia tsuruhatensis]